MSLQSDGAKWAKEVEGARVLSAVLTLQASVMALFAISTPDRFDEMPKLRALCDHVHDWLPQVRELAARGSPSNVVEVFLVVSPMVTAIFFLVYLLLKPPSHECIPIPSWPAKLFAVVALSAIFLVLSGFYWAGGASDVSMGITKGRAAAFLQMALSGRLGLATAANFLFSTGPLALLCVLWLAVTKPVARTSPNN